MGGEKKEAFSPKAHGGSGTFNPVNTVPQYRIDLQLGDIDALCDKSGTDAGRQQRMQVLGLLYEPLDSRHLNQLFRVAWNHFRKVANPIGTDAVSEVDADAALADGINKEIIVIADAGGPAKPKSELPSKGQFARIRLPGGFCLMPSQGERPLGDPAGHKWRFVTEERFFHANWRVGAIPILAKVKVENLPGKWSDAPAGLHVHFQLVQPDSIPPGSQAAAKTLRATTTKIDEPPPLPHGPQKYVSNQMSLAPIVPNDPQIDNCSSTRGGKRMAGVSGSDYFDTTSRPGFNDGVSALPVAAGSRHSLAVEAQTNASGIAGVIFRPSRQAGDRYKILAFLDPIGTNASNGTGASAVNDETGTMVVWRTLRVSKYLRFMYAPGTPAATKANAGGNLGEIEFKAKLEPDFARCYIELIVENTAKRKDLVIGGPTWRTAIRSARGKVHPTVAHPYHMETLFPDTLSVPPGAGLIRMRSDGDYNNNKPGGLPHPPSPWHLANAADWTDLLNSMLEMFMKYFSGNATSGLCVIHAPLGDTLDSSTSGQATGQRGCFLFYGNTLYQKPFPYDLQRNTLHEMGHCLMLPHQWTAYWKDRATENMYGCPKEHDFKDRCIMGYISASDYCGRCHLKLRGWDTSGIPINNV